MKKEFKQIQSWALKTSGELVHAHDVDKSLHETFRCPNCKEEMICRQGRIRVPHFAHKSDECNYDQYLHSLAKRRICEWFNKAEKVWIQLPTIISCNRYNECIWKNTKAVVQGFYDPIRRVHVMGVKCMTIERRKHDLKQWFHACEEERDLTLPDGRRFRADIMCLHEGSTDIPLFFEICVTHSCELQKINSGIPIIEIKIESEEDIERFINNETITESQSVKFYGFKPIESDERKETKEIPLSKYIHFPSNEWSTETVTCKDYDKLRKGDFEITMDRSRNDPCADDRRICNICKESSYFDLLDESYCEAHKKYGTRVFCRDNDPVKCAHFKLNPSLFDKTASLETVDVWQQEESNDCPLN